MREINRLISIAKKVGVVRQDDRGEADAVEHHAEAQRDLEHAPRIDVAHDTLTLQSTVDHLVAKLRSAPVTREHNAVEGERLDHFRWVRASGPLAAKLAGRVGDGFICTSGKDPALYTSLLEKLDGQPSPPDWMTESAQKDNIRTRIQLAVTASQVALDYCSAVRGILNDDQGGPLLPPGLRMAEGLRDVRESLRRNIELVRRTDDRSTGHSRQTAKC
mgnify:CR=1 FL=1